MVGESERRITVNRKDVCLLVAKEEEEEEKERKEELEEEKEGKG